MTWTPPPVWSVPREWEGERCFVLCGGASLRAHKDVLPYLPGRVIAVKQAGRLRPDADVLFISGEKAWEHCRDVFPLFRGSYIVARGKSDPRFPAETKRVARTPTHREWSEDPQRVAGYDGGTSAINLAMLFGASEIVLLGYDMAGGRWFSDTSVPDPTEQAFQTHLSVLPALAADARAKGVRVVNCSPVSRAVAFKYQPLEAFL